MQCIDTHTLWSVGACILALTGFEDREIVKMGRWAPKLNTFMQYIQQQLSTFSAGMSTAMSKVTRFTNVEGSV